MEEVWEVTKTLACPGGRASLRGSLEHQSGNHLVRRGRTTNPLKPVCVALRMIALGRGHSKLQEAYGSYESVDSQVAHGDSKLATCAEDEKLSTAEAQLVLMSCAASCRRRPFCELETVRRSNCACLIADCKDE